MPATNRAEPRRVPTQSNYTEESEAVATSLDPGPNDFAYDRARWERRGPRIAVLAGPHKTASTTLQLFFASLGEAGAAWEWPSADRKHVPFHVQTRGKFYASLAAFISGRHFEKFFPAAAALTAAERAPWRAEVAACFRRIFRGVLKDGRNVVMGAEAFDGLVRDLERGSAGAAGEEAHVARDSGRMIDALLEVFPWDNGTANATAAPLQLEDIEVHIHYRTPRTAHLISIWHQVGHSKTFRKFLKEVWTGQPPALYQSNSLALALQFVRRGIKTTLVDMAGVVEKEARATVANDTRATVVGGLCGVVACDVLRMGGSVGSCDHHGRLHLPRSRRVPEDKNRKDDRNVLNLRDSQLEEIERAYEDYDCGVWRHLRKYQAAGTLRVLHPAAGRFATCGPGPGPGGETRFRALVDRIREIAGRKNGIPVQTKAQKVAVRKARKKKRGAPASK